MDKQNRQSGFFAWREKKTDTVSRVSACAVMCRSRKAKVVFSRGGKKNSHYSKVSQCVVLCRSKKNRVVFSRGEKNFVGMTQLLYLQHMSVQNTCCCAPVSVSAGGAAAVTANTACSDFVSLSPVSDSDVHVNAIFEGESTNTSCRNADRIRCLAAISLIVPNCGMTRMFTNSVRC